MQARHHWFVLGRAVGKVGDTIKGRVRRCVLGRGVLAENTPGYRIFDRDVGYGGILQILVGGN